MQVYQLLNKNGKAVNNHFVVIEKDRIKDDRITTKLQSYSSIVVEVVDNCGMGFDKLVRFYPDWNYSKTTLKYVCQFLTQQGVPLNKVEIEKAIDRGYCRKNEAIAVMEEKEN